MDQRDRAIEFLMDKAKENRGEETNAHKQRRAAIDFLTGKQTRKPLRPEVRALLDMRYDNKREV